MHEITTSLWCIAPIADKELYWASPMAITKEISTSQWLYLDDFGSFLSCQSHWIKFIKRFIAWVKAQDASAFVAWNFCIFPNWYERTIKPTLVKIPLANTSALSYSIRIYFKLLPPKQPCNKKRRIFRWVFKQDYFSFMSIKSIFCCVESRWLCSHCEVRSDFVFLFVFWIAVTTQVMWRRFFRKVLSKVSKESHSGNLVKSITAAYDIEILHSWYHVNRTWRLAMSRFHP